MIYFDYNATTPLDARVLEAMMPYLTHLYGNPSSLYRFGRFARSAIETARGQLAALIDALPEQIIFTSGGTEANALALANAGDASLFISAIEHPAVVENARARPNPITVLEVESSGCIDMAKFQNYPINNGDFVSIMLANNETGAVQDVAGIAASHKGRGITLHCDAVQALGKMPISFKQLGVQLMSVSSHKIYGPKGCGALIFDQGLRLQALQRGGDQERGLRSGTENVAAIVGFGKAAELAKSELAARISKLRALRDRLEQQLLTIPDLVVFAQSAPRLPNTLQFGIPGIRGDMLLMQLDRKDIAVSSGSACSSGSGETSPVLKAMGIAPALANSAIRISLGKENNEQEVDDFVIVLKSLLGIH